MIKKDDHNDIWKTFICVKCGRKELVLNSSLEDAEFAMCVNNHIICESHLIYNIGFPGLRPVEDCPICTEKV